MWGPPCRKLRQGYEVSDWKHDMTLAQEAHIDAFALNMAHNEATNEQSVENAFQAAESLVFQLFFSFDYAGNGPWPQAEVIAMLQKYSSSSAHYRYQGKPFVSTFEGPGNAEDWIAIKAATGCFFVPDWSSLGAKPALQLAGGVADGLFSKSYMMPASPWFYTNMPGYGKNWLWHSDSLWYDRWVEIAYLEPEWVEIIPWNDYGESHYIGPLNEKAYVAFLTGRAPYNYVQDMPHDGWRTQLPYLIDLYKTGTSSMTKENLVIWYRTNPRTTCSGGGTTGNTASQLQIEYDAYTLADDKVFFSALLGSNATVTVSIGGLEYDGHWEFEPDGGVGIYHGSFPFNLHLMGEVIITISRHSKGVLTVKGKAISDTCVSGLANLNPWVGSATAGSTIKAVSPKLKLSDQTCIKGSGARNFAGLCQFTCKQGYPKNGDANYGELCSFACNLGYCPESACSETPSPPYIPPSSPFAAPACTGGESEHGERYAGLCSFACAYGYCPISTCWCATVGDLNVPPPPSDVKGVPDTCDADEYELLKGLCNFACSRDYCPPGACKLASEGDDDEYDDDDGDDDRPPEIIVDGSIWQDANPAVSCGSDCILVLPPVTLPSPTVITFDNDQGGYQTTLNVAWEVPVTTTLPDGQVVTTSSISHILQETRISVPPTTVSVLPLWSVTITSPTPTTTIYPMYRIPPQTIVITDDPNPLSEEGVSHPPVTRDITIPPYPWTCTTTATVTDVWVSCSTINSSSTSCTTTSSHVHTGCRATASATTTGVSDTCLLNSRDEDQGSDGGAGSGLITTIDDRKSTATTASKTTATPKPIPTRGAQQGVLTCQSDIDNYPQGDSRYYATSM
ncbi:glycosyl hydrolase family 71-domain-containing protein [Aspergillus pseudotamarii]|uniref:Glycosyl hydrolase family 71-domain-containing protein n=1 Tax=Aspergillus pseudotamarii TaxID=132259 RepID=A0A5N6SBG2_ASPPS|nr:glycosyl hydrolase family 71-domain-containing protein [Aspergillus pseudotamarii]KAE8132052.1 glycosyl hydrolase family 71-domain-containing protein [Aspergillus pseudotamarii]